MWLKSGFLLVGLMLALWPASLSSPGYSGQTSSTSGVTGGGEHESFISLPCSPEPILDPGWTYPRELPTFRGGARPAIEETPETVVAWVTHYSARPGAVVASEHPAGFRPGMAASYAYRGPDVKIMDAYLPEYGKLPFGTGIVVEGSGRYEVWDTGEGFPDSRPWLDIGVESEHHASELGANWRKIWVLSP